jgi:sarcosine oxidase subunit gamma
MSEPISITPIAPRSIAGIGAFRDQGRLLAALQAEFGIDIPTTPRFVTAGAITLSCLAPGRYLASADRGTDLPASFAKSLAGLAAITDQSNLWEMFSLSGAPVREVLARLVPIDLSPAKFRIGDLALTRAGHLDVRLWHVAEQTYELAVARSYADDLRSALDMDSNRPH